METRPKVILHKLAGIVFAAMWLASQSASGREPESLKGTNRVVFQPLQAAGQLDGCSLVFNVTAEDYGYRQGALVILTGALSSQRVNNTVVLMLKLGVKDLNARGTSSTEPPEFAYVQTSKATTANSLKGSTRSDGGHKLFVYNIDDATATVISEMLDGKPLTIGFNRAPRGLDVLADLDLHVVDVDMVGDQIRRTRSEQARQQFTGCVGEVTRTLMKR
jgi:hypothetical protein